MNAEVLRRRVEGERKLQALLALLVLGAALRLSLTIQWRPGFVGYSDSGIYFQSAFGDLWQDPIRTVGYSVVLEALHAISPHLVLVIVVQHVLGLLAGLGLYLALRRTTAPAWVALAGAGALLLGGSQVMLEHAALSEGIFTPLMVLWLYAILRAAGGTLRWAVLAGICGGLMVALKGVALVLLPIMVVCLACSAGVRPRWRTVEAAGLAAACALLVLGGYVVLREANSDYSGLTTNGNWNFYGRVAPFADCTKFDEPAGTEPLCADDPPAARAGRSTEYYIFASASPGIRYAGPAFKASPVPDAMETFGRFSRAAILGQPGDYLAAVWDDLRRLVDIDHPSQGQLTPAGLQGYLQNGLSDGTPTGNAFVESWRVLLYPEDGTDHGSVEALNTWERWTTPRGPLMLLALVLAAVAPFVAPLGTRLAASLCSLTTFALLLFPIVTKGYDYRFVIPAIAPLVIAASLAVAGLRPRVGASVGPSARGPRRARAARTSG